jgi:hypothetical protein
MTIQAAIDRIDSLKPNKYTVSQKIAWLSELDGMIFRELIEHHVHPEPITFEGYEDCTPMDKELLVPFPHTDVYQHYLAMQMDLANAELQKYQNDRLLFNSAYMTYSDYYTREHMPVQRVMQFRL